MFRPLSSGTFHARSSKARLCTVALDTPPAQGCLWSGILGCALIQCTKHSARTRKRIQPPCTQKLFLFFRNFGRPAARPAGSPPGSARPDLRRRALPTAPERAAAPRIRPAGSPRRKAACPSGGGSWARPTGPRAPQSSLLVRGGAAQLQRHHQTRNRNTGKKGLDFRWRFGYDIYSDKIEIPGSSMVEWMAVNH